MRISLAMLSDYGDGIENGTIYKRTQISQKEDGVSMLASQNEGGIDGVDNALNDPNNTIFRKQCK